MNFDELINKAISMAQSTGEIRRKNALDVSNNNIDAAKQIAETNANAKRYEGDSHVTAANLRATSELGAAGIHSEATKYKADADLTGNTLRGVAEVRASENQLRGSTLTANANLFRGQAELASGYTHEAAKQRGAFEVPGPGATAADRARLDASNAQRLAIAEQLESHPAVGSLLRNTAPSGQSQGQGLRPGVFGVQDRQPTPVATNRVASGLPPSTPEGERLRAAARVSPTMPAPAVSGVGASANDPTRLLAGSMNKATPPPALPKRKTDVDTRDMKYF